MHNSRLKIDLKEILADKSQITIEKSSIGGSSITLKNQAASEDFSSYIYYDRIEERDADFNELEKLLKE
jgi:hypothetical protein